MTGQSAGDYQDERTAAPYEKLPVIEIAQAEWDKVPQYPINFAPVFEISKKPMPTYGETKLKQRIGKVAACWAAMICTLPSFYSGLDVSATVSEGCEAENAAEEQTVTTPPISEKLGKLLYSDSNRIKHSILERLGDRNSSPVYRASSVTLFGYNGGAQPIVAGAGLVEHDNQLFFGTIAHVGEVLRANIVNESSYAHIPGVGFLEFALKDTPIYYGMGSENLADPIELLPISATQQEILHSHIEGKVLLNH